MNFLLNSRIGSRITTSGFKFIIRLFVWSTRFGKQTYQKKTIRAVWKAATKK